MSKTKVFVIMLLVHAWTCAALPLSDLPRSPGVKRIGVFVGTFDPLHYGHEQTIQAVLESGYVQAVVLLPQNFRVFGLKTYKPKALPTDERLDMALFRYQRHEKVFVPRNSSEFGDRFVSGAMAWIRANVPGATLYGIHGTDNYSSLLQRVFDRLSLRTDGTLLVEKYRSPNWTPPPDRFLGRPVHVLYVHAARNVSSTELRDLLSTSDVQDEQVEGLMDLELFDRVRSRGYYQNRQCAGFLQGLLRRR